MADSITPTLVDDGQSIPAALAATPASRKPRAKAVKTARAKVTAPVEHPLAALVEAEAAVEAEAPVAADLVDAAPVAVEPAPVIDSVPETVTPETVAAAPELEPVLTPVTTPTAAVPAEPQKESIMATTIDTVTDNPAKAQAFFADAGERAKGAAAKSAKLFEEATAFSKGNVEALVESSKIAAKGFETMGQDAAELGRKSFEEATTAFKTLASVKSPTEFLKLHSDFVRSQFDSLVAETSRSTETVLKLAGDVAQPLSNRVAIAAEKMKVAA